MEITVQKLIELKKLGGALSDTSVCTNVVCAKCPFYEVSNCIPKIHNFISEQGGIETLMSNTIKYNPEYLI
jgi:hypothetical protein